MATSFCGLVSCTSADASQSIVVDIEESDTFDKAKTAWHSHFFHLETKQSPAISPGGLALVIMQISCIFRSKESTYWRESRASWYFSNRYRSKSLYALRIHMMQSGLVPSKVPRGCQVHGVELDDFAPESFALAGPAVPPAAELDSCANDVCDEDPVPGPFVGADSPLAPYALGPFVGADSPLAP